MTKYEAVVHQSYFIKSISDSGGALYIEKDITFEVSECVFLSCISEKAGGAIHFNGNKLHYSANCAERCYLSQVEDNNYGNLLFAKCTNSVEFTLSSAVLCGPEKSMCADSTTSFSSPSINFHTSNFSECCSTYGTSGATLMRKGIVSEIIIHCGDSYFSLYYAFGSSTSKITIINLNARIKIFYSEETMTIKDSLILAFCGSDKIANNLISFQNCYGNVTSNGILPTETMLELFFRRCLVISHQKFQHAKIIPFLTSFLSLLK